MDRSLRRLLIVTDCSHGGTFHVATLLAEGLRDAFATSFAAPFAPDDATRIERLRSFGIDARSCALSYENLMRSSYASDEAAALLDATRPDLILSVDGAELSSLLAVKSVARHRDIPYVIVVNLLSEDVRERFAPLLDESETALTAAAAVVFVSAASRRRCAALLPDLRLKTHVIPNSCEDVYFEPADQAARRDLRRAFGIADGEILCLTAARIEKRKGHALGVAAFGRLKSEGRLAPFRWLLAGRAENWDRGKLEEAMATAGVADRIVILGERSDIPALLDASDLFLLTSHAEGMPLCIIESLAKGVPVIATAIDGIVEQIDESCGILLPPARDEAACVDALAAALGRLDADRRRLAEMSDAARHRARSHFHRSIGISRYRALLTKVLDDHPILITDADDDPAPGLRPGDTLDFGQPAQIWNFLQDGWSACERDGIWTDGTSSTMRLRLNADVTEVRLRFELSPFERRKDRSTIVLANDRRVGAWGTRRGRQTVSLDLDTRRTGSDVLLRFDNPGATRPCDIGMGDDTRALALFIHRLDLIDRGRPKIRSMVIERLRSFPAFFRRQGGTSRCDASGLMR